MSLWQSVPPMRVGQVFDAVLEGFCSFMKEKFDDEQMNTQIDNMLKNDTATLMLFTKQHILPHKLNLKRHDSLAMDAILSDVRNSNEYSTIDPGSLDDDDYKRLFDYLIALCELVD